MSQYAMRTYYYDECGFESSDEIIEIVSHNSLKQRITALVKIELADAEGTVTFEKGVNDVPAKSTFFCTAENDSGGRCSREVAEMNDRCWQHNEEDH